MSPLDLLAAVAGTVVVRLTPEVPISHAVGPSAADRRPSMAPEGPPAACPAEAEPTVSVPVVLASERSTIQVAEEVAAVPREENFAV